MKLGRLGLASVIAGVLVFACGDDSNPPPSAGPGAGSGGQAGAGGAKTLGGSSQTMGGSENRGGSDVGFGGEAGEPPAAGAGGMLDAGGAGGHHGGESGASSAGEPNAAGAGGAGLGGAGGEGGDGQVFVPGQCLDGANPVAPTMPASCEPATGDSACISCIKVEHCSEYEICFGEGPASACGRGMAPGEPGELDCIVDCFAANTANVLDADQLLADCAEQCTLCPEQVMSDDTNELIVAANDPATCQSECFPFE